MRKFSNTSATWQLFENTFLMLPPEKIPFVLDNNRGKGWAVNLAMGLNVCQRQWQQAKGISQEILQLSAKAKPHPTSLPGDDSHWIVEISKSPKHTKQRQGGSLGLMELLQQVKDTIPRESKLLEPAQPQQLESTIEDWLQKGNEMKNFSTEVAAGNIKDNRPTIPGFDQRPSNKAPMKASKYTRAELEAQGWTFDEAGNATPPKRKG